MYISPFLFALLNALLKRGCAGFVAAGNKPSARRCGDDTRLRPQVSVAGEETTSVSVRGEGNGIVGEREDRVNFSIAEVKQ